MYECHITVSVAHADIATDVAKLFGWKTSEIARDPLLGDDTFFYLTKHDRSGVKLRTNMEVAAMQLEARGVPVLRQKIEHIIFDTKTNTDLFTKDIT